MSRPKTKSSPLCVRGCCAQQHEPRGGRAGGGGGEGGQRDAQDGAGASSAVGGRGGMMHVAPKNKVQTK
ncbi:hypothetical protein HaLaN_29116, partial [Haematococcus lacustris]